MDTPNTTQGEIVALASAVVGIAGSLGLVATDTVPALTGAVAAAASAAYAIAHVLADSRKRSARVPYAIEHAKATQYHAGLADHEDGGGSDESTEG